MTHVQENGFFRGLSTDPTTETRTLPPSNFALAIDHLRALEEKGEILVVGLVTPERADSAAEVAIFIAPPETTTGIRALNEFQMHVAADLLNRPLLERMERAEHKFRADEGIPEEVKLLLKEGTICTPALIFRDQTKRDGTVLVQRSEIINQLGLAHCEQILTTINIVPNFKIGRVIEISIRFLSRYQNLYFGRNNVYKVFGNYVTRCITPRTIGQLNRGTFTITEPRDYLHELGVPITEEEVEKLIA